MKIGNYTHQYVKKVCRNEIPLTIRFQRELAMEVLRKYAFVDVKTRVYIAYEIAPFIKYVHIIPKNIFGIGKHCIIKQKNPVFYWLFDDMCIGIQLENLAGVLLHYENCGQWLALSTYLCLCEHIEWMCEQDGISTSKFPTYKNALRGAKTRKEFYVIINEVFTYKLKHNG